VTGALTAKTTLRAIGATVLETTLAVTGITTLSATLGMAPQFPTHETHIERIALQCTWNSSLETNI
jgi:hypothetical protein